MIDELKPGNVFAGYRIEQLLGRGGMGVVYRAFDLQLGRPVALKFVAAGASEGTSQYTNLLREARAAARLNHPNICTIYAAGEAEGRLFIAMEYLEGADLKSMVKNGPIAWKLAVNICRQIARALDEAHGKRLFHRDIKSANIFVTHKGVAKLLDFGLASYVPDPAATRSVAHVGTPPYMSPEQIDSGVADERSDIWSLGVVFYEMLTGRLPFGNDGKSVLRAILLDDPPPIRHLPSDAPRALTRVINTALQKNPLDRYSNAKQLLADLEQADSGEARGGETPVMSGRWQIRPQAQEEPRTVAVLPLVNLSSDPSDEFICDGLAEELINGLTGIHGLRVVSRSSSFQCRGTTLLPQELGERLRASHLVNGSLRRSGARLRLTAELSETRTGYLLWSQRFDAEMKDLFAVQDELSTAVLEQLRGRLSGSIERAKPRTADPAAYELYLRGRHFLNEHTRDGLREALKCFVRAQQIDPNQARNHIAVAECYASLEWYGLESAREVIPKVKEALENAVRLEPHSFGSLCLLATVQAGYESNWEAADETFQRALAASAGSADVWFHYGLDLLTPRGRLEEALEACLVASELDPLSAITSTAVGGCLYRLRRWKDAEASLRTALELHPGFGHAHRSLGRVLLEQGDGESAMQQFDSALRVMGPSPEALAERGFCLARLGRVQEARLVLNELDQISNRECVSPMDRALIFTGMGDAASALAQLELAFEQGSRRLSWANVDPRFHPLRAEPAFQQLMLRIGL